MTRTGKAIEHPMLAQDVADVLAQETLDALPEFLHAVDVGLRHAPGAIRRVRRPWREGLDLLLHSKVPRHVRHQILDPRKSPHRLDGGAARQVALVQPRHAHEPWLAVDFG